MQCTEIKDELLQLIYNIINNIVVNAVIKH